MIQEIKKEERQPEPEDDDEESVDSETQGMKRLQWKHKNRKPKN